MVSILPADPKIELRKYPGGMLRLDFVTLFPEVIRANLAHSIMKRAAEAGAVQFETANPRDYCYDRHQKVDDAPFGGAPGMLIKAEPVAKALEALGLCEGVGDPNVEVISTDPTGVPFTQAHAQELSTKRRVAFLCGHYEGIDNRVVTRFATRSFSVGDFVVTNGALPALLMADAVVRLLPGVLGSHDSLLADSHNDGLLSAPNFTRPEVWRGESIPEVLKSGDHRAIEKWRRTQALIATRNLRPDLLVRARLETDDLHVLSS